MIAASPNPSHDARAKRMIAALIGGAGLDAIAAQEKLPAKEAETILREELGRRWVAPLADFAKIQIARLENLCLHVMDRVDERRTRGGRPGAARSSTGSTATTASVAPARRSSPMARRIASG